jgi:hypothetical protein
MAWEVNVSLLVVEKPAHSKSQDVRIILGAYKKFPFWQVSKRGT